MKTCLKRRGELGVSLFFHIHVGLKNKTQVVRLCIKHQVPIKPFFWSTKALF